MLIMLLRDCGMITDVFAASFEAAAKRGLLEELGLDVAKLGITLERILDTHLQQFEYSSVNKRDNEFVETYRLVFDGEVVVDGVEVEKAVFVSPAELIHRMQLDNGASFTPWFLSELKLLAQSQ
eukprot:TRINITY_DN1309_c0_g1_i1.p2 TRINITY_DN1309_c0_g1~~TRINITY_DN1309_c0_g1_i1.p2  ORF type:complete len:124 (-),score=41.97 TRINITY_DN1309_c0_g1_i1:310-681(-)